MNIAKYIDHTILKPDATEEEVLKLCSEAKAYGFASVCVNQFYTAFVHEQLKGTSVKTCTVVGFPLGAVSKEVKAYETALAVKAGADEIDMVINVGALKDGKYDLVRDDIRAVVEAAKPAIVKVILETCLLNETEKIKGCELSTEAGAAFVKTSTGFSTGGATVEDIRLMRKSAGPEVQVKASGGVRDFAKAMAMIEAGADRIGTSSGISITENVQSSTTGY